MHVVFELPTTVKSLSLSPWCPPCRHQRMLLDTLKAMSFPGWPSPAPSGSPQRARDPAMTISLVSTKLAPVYWLLPILGSSKRACSSLEATSESKGWYSLSFINRSCSCWYSPGCFCPSLLPGALLTHIQLSANHCLQGLSCRAGPQPGTPSLSLQGAVAFQGQDLLNFVKLKLAHSSRLSRPLWMAALSSNILSRACSHLQTWWECSPSPPSCHW